LALDKRQTALHNFKRQKIKDPELEYRALRRVISEHLDRHTQAMFEGKNYDVAADKGVYNKDLAKEAIELIKGIKVLDDMWTKLQKQAKADAALMSIEERTTYFCEWLLDPSEVGPNNLRKAIKLIWPALREAEVRQKSLKLEGRIAYDQGDPADEFYRTPAEQSADAQDDERAPETWVGDDGLERIEVGEDWDEE
jgi:hypothetical protein